MKDKLRAAQAAALDRIRIALAYAGAHRFWVESAALTLLGLLALVAYSSAALSRTTALRAQADELRTVQGALDRWRSELRPASPTESVAWRDSEESLRGLAGDAVRPLTVARLLAQRAEEAGVDDLSIRVIPQDSVTPIEPVQIGSWSMTAEGEGLVVEFDGDMSDIVGFLGVLPAQVAVSTLRLTPAEGRLRATVVLLTRRVAEGG